MDVSSRVTTILFTDIEGSTRLWEQEGERMAAALARHDLLRALRSRATAASSSRRPATASTPPSRIRWTPSMRRWRFQQSLADPAATNGIPLRVRCGLHLGVVERRDNDYFGTPVNRTARIMSVAHGGQIVLSQAVVDEVGTRLPAGITLRDLGNVRLKDLATPEHVYQVAASGAAPGIPGAALARGDAQQPAAAADVVHRPRARNRRGDGAAGDAPAC